jgi:hypothetical protein
VYLFRVLEPFPIAKMPTVLLPAAAPYLFAAVAAPPAVTVHPGYVYLLRAEVVDPQVSLLSVKIPTVLLPVAEPSAEAEVADVAAPTTSPEYVYLLRVAE